MIVDILACQKGIREFSQIQYDIVREIYIQIKTCYERDERRVTCLFCMPKIDDSSLFTHKNIFILYLIV